MACLACGGPKARQPAPERPPPPRVLVVTLEPVALRASAWVELHAWLATAGRSSGELTDPQLGSAAHGYRELLQDDEGDELVTRVTRLLEACEDQRCAENAVKGTRFATPYLRALPAFLARHWTERATLTRAGMEAARLALEPTGVPLAAKVAQDLAIAWPAQPPSVVMVGEAPPPGRTAPLRMSFAARGPCFAGATGEAKTVHDARIIDCALAYASIRLRDKSELAEALLDELQAKGKSGEFAHAWSALVAHAVATTLTGLEPKHSSPLRRSAALAMPQTMNWLAQEWPSRLRGEPVRSFAQRYAEVVVNTRQ